MIADAFWVIVVTVAVFVSGMSVLALMLLGAALWFVEWLMRSLERLEVPGADD